MSVTQTLYYALPVAAQNALVSAYGYRLRRKRHVGGAAVRARIAAAHSWTAAEIASYQLCELRSILAHCSNIPHYREDWRSRGIHAATIETVADLERLPILTKETVRRAGAELMTPGVRPYWTQHTSGSTGTPVTVRVNRHTYQLVHALLEDHERACGIQPDDLRATFAGRMVQPADRLTPPFWRMNHALRQILFSAYHLGPVTLPLYVEELARRQPAEIIGYPSAIVTVAGHVIASGQQGRIRPRVVITNSETLFGWQRDTIREAFGCPVRDYYGSAEAVVFAAECPAGAYHFNPLIGIAEVVDERGRRVSPGCPGRLVCTTLTNDLMPLVRYEIGDMAVRLDGPCTCGSRFDAIREILGRQDDVITTPEGIVVGRIDHIFKGASGIRECQVVQESIDLVRLLVVPDERFGEAEQALLVENARARLGPAVRIEVSRVNGIPRSRAGKFRGVVSRVPNPLASRVETV